MRSMTVICGGERNRMGGPQVPVPRLTCSRAPFARRKLPLWKGKKRLVIRLKGNICPLWVWPES